MEGALQDLLLELPAAPMDKKGFIASFSAVGLRERALSSRSEPSFSQMLLGFGATTARWTSTSDSASNSVPERPILRSVQLKNDEG